MTLFRLPVEDLDQLHGRQILRQVGVQGGDLGSGDPVGGAVDPGEQPGQKENHGQQDKAQKRQFPLQEQHDARVAQDQHHVFHHGHKDGGEQLVEGLHVVGDPGDDPPDGGDVKEPQGQLVDVGEDLLPERKDDGLTQLLEHEDLDHVADGGQNQQSDVEQEEPNDGGEQPAGGDGVDGAADDDGPEQVACGGHQHQNQRQEQGGEVGPQIPHEAEEHALTILLHGGPPFPPGAEAPAAAAHRAGRTARPFGAAPHGCRIRRRRRPPGIGSGPQTVRC